MKLIKLPPICRLFLVVFTLLIAGNNRVAAQANHIYYIGEMKMHHKKPSTDTTPYLNLFKNTVWDVKYTTSKGNTLQFTTTKPEDTLKFTEPTTIHLSSTFIVNPALLNQILAIKYTLKGSLQLLLNGDILLQTGFYAIHKKSTLSSLNQDAGYVNFLFKDTLQKIEINYITHPNMNFWAIEELSVCTNATAIANQITKNNEANNDYRRGFYYLAFAIILFTFFIFNHNKTEILYFAAFCFFASISFLWDRFYLDDLEAFQFIPLVFSFEFLSLFFVKIFRNKEKSKKFLFITIIFALASFLPAIRNNYSTFFGNNTNVPWIMLVMFLPLVCYSFSSSVYYLFSGFGKKQWEARVIVYTFLFPLVICYIPCWIVGNDDTDDFKKGYNEQADKKQKKTIEITYNEGTPKNENKNNTRTIFDILASIGVFIYPLSASIVLARRNGLNYKQLLSQIKSIQQLSAQNMEKEQEKQQILENQNAQLELKVQERTAEVVHQKELIEIKNKAITDNVTYAQRIQAAILPDIKLIYKALEQSFILFMPKDIVSGDFYAFAEKNGRVLIIAGDCTGHGVTGAFMSMIGSAILNQIINEKAITEPAEILTHLNFAIIDALKQTENETNDGMDISIVSFDLPACQMQYACANRPLWMVRQGILEVFKPDKFPIGGLQVAKHKTFTNHTVHLQKNDTIYIFTDGYADQFGGTRGKKMMTSKFKEVLASIQDLTMPQQETYLKNFFDQWKHEHEQVDDVLVIGVRV